jgi:ComEC/Rec2-related protein
MANLTKDLNTSSPESSAEFSRERMPSPIPAWPSDENPDLNGLDLEAETSLLKDAHEQLTEPGPVPQKLLAGLDEFAIPALVLFLLGNVLAFALPELAFAYWPIAVPILTLLLGIIVAGASKPDSRWMVRLNIWTMILILGAVHYHYRQFTPGPADISRLAPSSQIEVRGIVLNRLAANRLVLAVDQAGQKKTTGQLILYLPQSKDNQPLEPGTRLLAMGELDLPHESTLPGVFNYRHYLKGQHITALLKHPSRLIAYELSQQPTFVLQRWTEQLKQTISDSFSKALPSPQAEILGGIVLGDKAIPIDSATKQAFIQTGLIHVLAASGMNVGIIAMAVLWLLKALKTPRKIQFGVAMAAVAFYSLLTGLPPSIQRASAMLELALLLKMLNKELSPLFLLCLATTLLVIAAPDNIASVGFQFSVLTTFGLIAMVSPLQEWLGYYITRWLAGLILVPFVAQLWIWPLSIAYFNQFPVHSVPLNIVALALVAPLTILGFVAALVSIVFAPLGSAMSGLAKPLLDVLLWVVQGGNQLTWAQWSLPSPEPWQMAGMYFCLFVLLGLIDRVKAWSITRRSLLGLIPVAVLLGGLCLENSQAHSQARVEWLPLSEQKQAVLLKPAHSESLLLIAPQRLRAYEARSLGDFIRHRRITHLSALLLLPSTEAEASGTGSLKQALQHTEIDLLIGSPDLKAPDTLNIKRQAAFPASGAQAAIGKLRLEGLLDQLLVFSDQYCLLALHQSVPNQEPSGSQQTTLSNRSMALMSSDCAVQANMGASLSTKLENENTQSNGSSLLSAEQYHQWIQEGPRLTLF